MVDNCKHIPKVKLASDHSILNPEKWLCATCGTTESVWACLSCAHVACGRYNEEHALKHFHDSKHPIAIEVNEKYVYCYQCDEYALNDNAAGDIKLLRSSLNAIATQSYDGIEARGKRILRSRPFSEFGKRVPGEVAKEEDRSYTALWHRRLSLMTKVFGAWRTQCPSYQSRKVTPERQSALTTMVSPGKKPTVQPGVTGLRNLGNTCYMNSILQVLGHLEEFKNFFLTLRPENISKPSTSYSSRPPADNPKAITRQTTVECFQYATTPHQKAGLNGGSLARKCRQKASDLGGKDTSKNLSLCQELHALFRVMWSGKWALLSPHSLLHAVWDMIPNFKGFAQQDAEEFLCELLDKVKLELTRQTIVVQSMSHNVNIVDNIFKGEILSQVKCLACGKKSVSQETFMDLSLEFPDRYQIKDDCSLANEPCHVTEMLAKFTENEKLDGEAYACDKCNETIHTASDKNSKLTEADKKLVIHSLPHVLRLHLKRFRWAGRNHREKILTHVDFNIDLNMQPFCDSNAQENSFLYTLSAVVIHHGRGFGSGHYTAYVYNSETEGWLLCNDARMQNCGLEDVLTSQAYILFYTRYTQSVVQNDLNFTPINICGAKQSPDTNEDIPTKAKDRVTQEITEIVDEDISFNFSNSFSFRYKFKRKLDGSESSDEGSGDKSNCGLLQKRRKTC